ncbi:PD-(D/E)XK nuclease family protein [Haladaptatus sp. AB643]|uniref:PD-(D/E)XK nuclease family protein n=1 Tax=Haladaptatus sp. AB643 TaxID=2934174 RepID=UPI00209C62B8|nr:PD-(D/E)XK nuclease family protein [Haladaptatus sp. AB643]MCO8242976.1 PD-(D/E)XK nuclease family protein [Haladaptatus sp. AB643]
MIHSLGEITNNSDWSNQEVTVQCTVTDGPKTGKSRGEKTLYTIDTSHLEYSDDAFLSIWHESPNWSETIGETTPAIRDLLAEIPLQAGEKVLVRGIPNRYQDKWYLNVSSILIRQPGLTIGKSEMRSASECPRIYDLLYEKSIFNESRYDFSAGALKGNIAHRVLEKTLEDSIYKSFFTNDLWDAEKIDDCIEKVITEEYSLQMALCRIAWISTNRIKENAREALEPLFTNDEFIDTIADYQDSIEVERTLSPSIGFNGRVDLVVDGTPYDLKTNYTIDSRIRAKHRFQLRLYLLALLLETLEPGESMKERVTEGTRGYLLYPNLKHSHNVEIEEVLLRERDIIEIMELRNEVAVLRDSFGIPTTYGRDCRGCAFKKPDVVGKGDSGHSLPSACKFYCQSERRWPCFENEDGKVTSQCPLFAECDQRLELRDPRITDHYNRLRNGLKAEQQVRRKTGERLDQLDETVLEKAGLRLNGLKAEAVRGKNRVRYSFEEDQKISMLGFISGESVQIHPEGSQRYRRAIYCGRANNGVVFQFEEKPDSKFKSKNESYTVTKTLESEAYPRDLLSQLDFAQRAGVSPLVEPTGEAINALETLLSSNLPQIAQSLDNKEVYVNLPCRPDRSQLLENMAGEIAEYQFAAPNTENLIPQSDQRILFLTSSPTQSDRLQRSFSGKDNVVRLDGFFGSQDNDVSLSAYDDAHSLYEAISESKIVISSQDYAISEKLFHAMEEGDEGERPHSDRFFDAVILIDATRLAEPQFHFLQILGDRLVAIGDIHRSGPEIISEEAQEEGLSESYFVQSFNRFANLESESAQCLTIPSKLPDPAFRVFGERFEGCSSIGGSVQFKHVSGEDEAPLTETTITKELPCSEDEPRYLRLKPQEPVSAMYISRKLGNLRVFDAEKLRMGRTYTIAEIRFEVLTSAPADGDVHELDVNVPLRNSPYLNRRLLANKKEAEEAVKVAKQKNVDAILTPFVSQAQDIQCRLDASDGINVYLPSELDDEILDSAVLSTTTANEERVVADPLTNPEIMYELLTAARNLTVVGDKTTLERNSLFQQFLIQ